MLSPKKKLINKIRSFLLLEQDKEINKIINSSNTRINGLTSKEFMEKNKINYEISINNGIIYDCYKLPKNEEIECNIFGKFCNNIKIHKFQKIKENKINLVKLKNPNFQKKNKNINLIYENQINLVKKNINFLKKISFYLKNPENKRINQRKSVENINVKRNIIIKINKEIEPYSNSELNSNSESESMVIPIKKKSTKNLKKIMMDIDKEFLKNIYNKSYILSECYREIL
jgi:hypothetical protein